MDNFCSIKKANDRGGLISPAVAHNVPPSDRHLVRAGMDVGGCHHIGEQGGALTVGLFCGVFPARTKASSSSRSFLLRRSGWAASHMAAYYTANFAYCHVIYETLH